MGTGAYIFLFLKDGGDEEEGSEADDDEDEDQDDDDQEDDEDQEEDEDGMIFILVVLTSNRHVGLDFSSKFVFNNVATALD